MNGKQATNNGNNMDDFDDDILDRNIDQLDVRETPRWELSEEEVEDEHCGDSEVDTLLNQKGERKNGPVVNKLQNQENIPLLKTALPTQRPSQGMKPMLVGPKGPQRPGSVPITMNGAAPQSPILNRPPSAPHSCASTTESVKTVMSPMYARKLDKAKIDALVKATYAEDSDIVKDFGAVERSKKAQAMSVPTPKPVNPVVPTSTMKEIPHWEEDDDADSIKDFTRSDRKKEEKYRERTDEAIYQRASEEHIKRPPIWHDEEVDSLRDFGRISGKQEMPSGITSQQLSRLPSDEELCLSPPWNDEDDGPVRNFACEETDHKSYGINKMVTEERMRQAPPWHEDDMDSTKDYAEFCKMASIENSRRPSEENIYLTPPWMEDDRSSCASNNTSSVHMTLEEKRAIEEEARNSGLAAEGEKAQAIREEQTKDGASPNPQLPGRDSGFCSEQDQHAQQAQVATSVPAVEEKDSQDFPSTSELLENLPEVSNAAPAIPVARSVAVPYSTAAPISTSIPMYNTTAPPSAAPMAPMNSIYMQSTTRPLMTTAAVNPVARVPISAAPHMPRQNVEGSYPARQQPKPEFSSMAPRQIAEGNHIGIVRQGSGDAAQQQANRVMRQTSMGVPPMPGNPQEAGLPVDMRAAPRTSVPKRVAPIQRAPEDSRMWGISCPSNKGDMARSVSHSSLEANCYSPHDALEGLETSSVVSFASTAATRHDLETRIDMMQSLLSLLGTHDKDDMSRTLLAMSNSKDSCAAMRQSGCLPLLIDLLHGHDNPMSRRDARSRAGLALHNIVYSNVEDRRGRREIRVLRLLEIVRAHCDVVHYGDLPPHPCAERWYPPLRDYGPGPAVAALMKLSFEEEHRTAICELGGMHAIAELMEIDHKVNAQCKDFYSISLRKYAGMTLTNLTFGNTKNKTILCKMEKTLEALIAQLGTVEEEEIVQVSASVLRNLSWRADDVSREALREVGATRALIEAGSRVSGEPALRTILSALWNLSAHCTENKTELCSVPGAIKFLVKCLSYCSPSGNISVVESSGGILRNLSSHIAVRTEFRKILRENACFHTLLSHLRSPSLRVVSNACGALWNLSARCPEDQELLWELGAVSLLKSLANSKHKAISTASSAALRNLMAVKPTSSHATDNESVASRNTRRYRSMPAGSRTHEAQAKIRHSTREGRGKAKSPGSQSPIIRHSPQTQSPRAESPHGSANALAMSRMPRNEVRARDTESVASAAHSHSSSGSTRGNRDMPVVPQQTVPERQDVEPYTATRKQKGVDSSSVGSSASLEGRHNQLGRWSGSNDSLSRHRRQKGSEKSRGKHEEGNQDPTSVVSPDGHSRSSSDGGTVIQLVTDSYPLQVTARNQEPKPCVEGATARVRQALGYTGSQPSVVSGRQSDTASVVSPGTARRLNQWAEIQASESIEMASLSSRTRGECHARLPQNAAAMAASRESVNSSRQRRKRVQKFRSYRDTDSDPEADIDSDDEKTMFSARGNTATGNAWVKKGGSRNLLRGHSSGSQSPSATQSPRMQKKAKSKEGQCVCNEASNVWIKRPNTLNGVTKRMCEKCNKERVEGTADSRTVVKTRRNSGDSPMSSPSALRGAMVTSDYVTSDGELAVSKRGVKVTSL